MNIYTSVVMFVKDNENVMVMHAALCFFDSECSDSAETETKDRTVT